MSTGLLLASLTVAFASWVLGVRWAARTMAERKWAQSDGALEQALQAKRARLDERQKQQTYEPMRRVMTEQRRKRAAALRVTASSIETTAVNDDAERVM